MTSRIHRGFHRVGIALAAIPMAVAAWVAVGGFWKVISSRDPWEAYFDVAPAYVPDFQFAGLMVALAVTLYAAARAVGWILAGFMGQEQR